MVNNVNELTGKEWLKNSVNFWFVNDVDNTEIFNRIKNLCYKDRTNNGYIYNKANNYEIRKVDFSFSVISSIKNAKIAIQNIFCGAKKSYHAILLENEIVDNIFIFPFFTKFIKEFDIEYRGKIIVYNQDKDIIKYLLIFLKNSDDFIECDKDYFESKLPYDIEKEYIIESKSKMDKIGLKHPAPFSYIDINKICERNNIVDKTILDPFLGVGSTIIGAYKNNKVYGIELNEKFVDLTYERFNMLNIEKEVIEKSTIICGDCLSKMDDICDLVDVVITSPPYFNILKNKTSGIRTDASQSRQGIEYYSDKQEDIGNLDNYDEYIKSIKQLFIKINKKMNKNGEVYIVLSDFTINKKENDIHSDYVLLMKEAGYKYCGTSYILQNQKAIYPFGYPYKIVLNHIYQYVIKFKRED